ncbi:MAG: [protein-PII] uridylyltransferase [Burkholderiales bacterium]
MSGGLQQPANQAAEWRQSLQLARQALREDFAANPQPARLLRLHSAHVDATLRQIWKHAAPSRQSALVATGGYGRRELYPCSDIDLLVLIPHAPSAQERERLERLVGLFWDVGLEVGHSVRTVEGCLEEAAADVTVQTALLEARLIAGSKALHARFAAATSSAMDPAAFFKAKKLEQEQRHAKHLDVAYALEPNLKEAPGGLRDLQVIRWIAQACGIGRSWRDLVADGLVLPAEAAQLARHESTLQQFRIRLHYLAGRREDRIAFDYQSALAEQSGCRGAPPRRASEQVMQRYYRTAQSVIQLNTILMQNLEARLLPEPDWPPRELNERFLVRGELLDVRDPGIFEDQPHSVLEGFLLMQQHQELRGMSATMLRALWRARRRIGGRARRHPVARLLFLHILQQPRGIVHEFRRMNQYGILAEYLPEFGRIAGQMQHDLFHVYTVDQHILMVLRNLRRFTMPDLAHEFPLCSQLMSGFPRNWLLYVAALYHDIAKGRGGDHSVLGAAEASRFCVQHGIAPDDASLVRFLVEHHLSMSAVAQKQDVHDPEVITAFAATVGSERRLVALYLLTVADVRGTSPKVWNAWKAKLLEDLFRSTRRALTGEILQLDAALAHKQAEAARLLRLYALPDTVKERFWAELDTPYFLRHDAQEIAWQTRMLHARVDTALPVVRARLAPIGEGLQVLVYAPDREALFARICGYFDRVNFNIVEAKVHTTRGGRALDSFLVMGQGPVAHYRDMIGLIETDLAGELNSDAPLAPPRAARVSRRVRHFPITPVVDIRPDERDRYHVLSLVAADRPGLLYSVASILATHRINLHTARINTLGDRVEDVLLVSGPALRTPKKLLALERELLKALQVGA